jgi:hypothetical protein
LILQFKTSDYWLAMPKFVSLLEVPFIALAEVGPVSSKLNQSQCVIFSMTLLPGLLAENWLNFCGKPVTASVTVKSALNKLGSVFTS